MENRKKLTAAKTILKNRFTDTSDVLAVRWNLTYRCNFNCSYCNLPEKATPDDELSTGRIKEILREMGESSVQRISFSGGEPLLREDIGEIIEYTNKVGITPTMNTNGSLVSENIDSISNLDTIKISLDGPKDVHNKTRSDFNKVLDGLDLVQERGINTSIITTLTSLNYERLPELVRLVREHDTILSINRVSDLNENFEDSESIMPEKQELEKTINEIIDIKRENPGLIRNSIRHLKLIKEYPNHESIECTAGNIFFIILPDGTVTPCDRISCGNGYNLKEKSFEEIENRIGDVTCHGCCFCASMELNYIYHMKLDILKDLFNYIN